MRGDKRSIIFFFLTLSVTAICFAQSNYTESLTITTYYPAPYGVYRDLQARKSFAVGNFTAAEVQSLNPGDIRTSGVIIVGNGATAVDGAFRFNGTGFEGYYDGGWHPLLGNATSANITAGTLAGAGSFTFFYSSPNWILTCGSSGPITPPAKCGPYDGRSWYQDYAECEPGWLVYNKVCPGGLSNPCSWTCQKLP